jgi:hypothetical protein
MFKFRSSHSIFIHQLLYFPHHRDIKYIQFLLLLHIIILHSFRHLRSSENHKQKKKLFSPSPIYFLIIHIKLHNIFLELPNNNKKKYFSKLSPVIILIRSSFLSFEHEIVKSSGKIDSTFLKTPPPA